VGARRPSTDRGAAAVEFALVVPILLLMLFGMIDYGLFFNNAISVKQGVREAARQGVVSNFGSSCATITWAVTPSADLQNLGCTLKDRNGSVVGTSYYKVKVPSGWVKGQPLVICSMVKTSGLTGWVPLPGKGLVSSRVEMSIEKVTAGQTETGGETATPTGTDWSWC
jgi:Flp pilus assembly protein TadG